MGVYCEINLHKPSDGAFVPGGTVSGDLKYAVDEETEFSRITVSLKGNGRLLIKDKGKRRRDTMYRFRNTEEYIDIDNVIYKNEKGVKLPIGSYETAFSFKLPYNIPPTFVYETNTVRYFVRCHIRYYVRIKFEKSGLMTLDKKFKKDITVVSGITPKLPVVPAIYGEQKTLTQLFSSKKSIVNIKATVESSVISRGGTINFNYEVSNDTNVTLKSVETKLIEAHKFTTSSQREVELFNDVKNTDSKTGSIKCGDVKTMDVEINVPSDNTTVENSKIVSRNYLIHITVELPMPHRNAVLEIPVQIGDQITEANEESDEPPPSYWEAMGEENKEALDDDDSGDEEKS